MKSCRHGSSAEIMFAVSVLMPKVPAAYCRLSPATIRPSATTVFGKRNTPATQCASTVPIKPDALDT
jgi:hypothetical protein